VIAFLGLGKMGERMAARLGGTFPVKTWSRSGRGTAPSARECVQDVDFVVAMLSDAGALASVVDDICPALKAGTIVIDMATSGRASALAARDKLATVGAKFIDAPVSGTVGPAERGELIALVGAEEEDLAAARPVFHAMCKRIVHAGSVGQGQALKVVLNGVGAHHLVAFASMLALGERAGLTRDVILEAFTSGAFASPSYVGKRIKVLARDYSPEFTLAHTAKDAVLTADLAREAGIELPVFREVRATVDRGVEAGLGEEDLFALEKLYPRD
jgi:3-hydroxyisobutyrate dehydrogenase